MTPVIACIVAVIAMLVARWRDRLVAAAFAKAIAASAFVWAAIAWGAPDSVYGRTLLAGLVLCWLGDLLLVPPGTSIWFRLGMVAFLLAHLVYLAAFALWPLDSTTLAIAVPLAATSVWLILRWLWPHLGSSLRLPVSAYVVSIAAMTAFAITAAVGGAPASVAAGASMFVVSDLAVARDRFIHAGLENKLFGQPLYFAAQLVLASSVWAA